MADHKLPNYFDDEAAAARYCRARPSCHAQAVEMIRSLSGVERFRRALDVGCGTGASTIALAAIAEEVIGIDSSPEMLAQAPATAGVSFRLGRAEFLDLDGEFDLIAVALALHWFQQESFYAGCRRLLAPGGVLAVYNDHFTTHMRHQPACSRWMRSRFARRFPQPRRGMRDLDEAIAIGCGFSIARRSSFERTVPWSRDEFVDYLLTRSHTLAPVQAGRESENSIAEWLHRELLPMLPDGATGEFVFKCNLWLLST
jgi:SAM-dependent methyltransferase